MFECPACGANIKFDPTTQMMVCEYCGKSVSPHEMLENKSAEENVNDIELENELTGEEYDVYYYTCPQCGGVLMTEDTTAATFCSYCGASTQLEMRMGKQKKASYIIPFRKNRQECEKAYKNALSRAIFAPSSMKKDSTIERFRGIYMPYWIYRVTADGQLSLKGKKDHRSGDYIIHDHYKIDSFIEADYSGISFDASSSFEDRLSEAIAPFDLRESEEFSSAYLSGFYADTDDVSQVLYDNDAIEIMTEDASGRMTKAFNYSSYSVTKDVLRKAISEQTHVKNVELGMFPVWFLSNRTGDRVSYAVVNGQTGKVAMDIPIDIKKYLLGSLILALAIFALLALTPIGFNVKILLFFIMLADVMTIIIAGKQMNTLFTRELMLNDKGYNSTRTEQQRKEVLERLDGNVKIKKKKPAAQKESGIAVFTKVMLWSVMFFVMIGNVSQIFSGAAAFFFFVAVVIVIISNIVKASRRSKEEKVIYKAPMKEKIGVLIKPYIALGIALLVMVIHPFYDYFYYGVAIVSAVLTAITVSDLVKHHNKLSSRRLPQFNKRGGEQYETYK